MDFYIKMNDTVVVIPTYNESENVIALIDSLLRTTSDLNILIVDDNSPDETFKLVQNHEFFESKVFLLLRSEKNGLGKAYISGFNWGLERNYKFIAQMDADFSHPYSALSNMIALSSQENAVVVGSRWIKGGRVVGWPLHRLFLSKMGSYYARTLLRIKTRDVTSGFKVIPRHYLQLIDYEKFVSSGYAFQIELQESIRIHHIAIIEFPIVFTERVKGQSKMSGKIAFEAFIFVLRIFVRKKLRNLRVK